MELDGEPWLISAILDITERKEAEARLQAQDERFQRIIAGTDAGYFRIGMDGCYEDVNPAWLRMHGFTRREDAIGLHFSAVQVPEDEGNAEMIVGALKRGEALRNREFSRLLPDGTIGYHSLSATPVFDGDRVVGVEGFTIDITELKAAERERQHSERQYMSLFNSMQEGVALHKLVRANGAPENYILLDVNRRFEELLGMKREHVVNKLATEVYRTEPAPYLKEYASVVEEGRPLQFETYFSPPDKIFVISATPIAEDLFATIFFDITEQKRAQERYQLISENAADVIWLWDLEEGRCVYVSPSVQQLRGFSPEEILAQPTEQAMPGDTYRRIAAEAQTRRAAVDSGDEGARIQTNEVEFLRKDGTTVATETVTKLVSDARGKVRYIVGASRDITVLKRAEAEKAKIEDQLRQAQKLESVGRLAAGVAHDFNNLLTVINGYSRLVLADLGEDDPLRESIGEILGAGERAAGLTQQLLAFSRKQVLKPRLLVLNSAVAEMTDLLRRVLGENIQLKLTLAQPAVCIRADLGQMQQLILNLAINARDAMPQGGVLSIETSNLTLSQPSTFSSGHLPPGSYALLSVSDTGCGMTPEVQAHLFEPFFTTKDAGKGTGLGLSNVYGVVKQSGGEITVTTSPGRGAAFHIYLPRFEGHPGEEESTHLLPAAHGGHETVLLVEDEELVRMMLVEVLKSAGYLVLDARHGTDALALSGQYAAPMDLLVTDVTMPGFSGVELARRLAEMRPSLRVLFISGYTDQEAAQWGKLSQPVQFLQKPFHPDAFLAKVRQILDHSSA
jgi:PAS domain S-box-containing protein